MNDVPGVSCYLTKSNKLLAEASNYSYLSEDNYQERFGSKIY